MGAGLTKSKLSPEPHKRIPRGTISVAPLPTSTSSKHDGPEDEFLEKIANNYMKRDRKSFHTGGTTYAGVDLRLEVDCVDTPATLEDPSEESYDGDDAHSETSEFDDGYYTVAEKVLYEKPKPKPDNTQFIVSWKKGSLLGSGGFGKVYLGLDNETGAMFAVKEISLGGDVYNQTKELKSFKQEVAVMKNLRHENIVQYLGTMEEENELNIFLEYVPGGSIALILSKFGSFSEPLVKRYTRQILSGLEYLHSHHIIHRDIKGANILVDNCGVVKLADFGASKKMEALMTTTGGFHSLKGTPYWMAPEVIRQSGYGRQADIWSVGCTVIEMSTGKPPFHEFTDQVSVLFHIASSNSPPPIPSHLSPMAQDFLLKCFERNPANRPNARGLLEHPFLKEDGRKNSSGYSSPKANHSFSSPRNKDGPIQPVQFAKAEEPRQQSHVHSRSNTPQPIQVQPQPLQTRQDDDIDNMMEEPTWSWGGDKRKISFADKFPAGDLPNYSLSSKRSDSFTSQNGRPANDSIAEVVGDYRRHKRAISVTPEKMIPSTPPPDVNAPPPARLSMRRHSALESSIREASEFVRKEGLVPTNGNHQHSNGLCSSPSTPGRMRAAPDEHNLFNNNMANFTNTFNQTFNSINNINTTTNTNNINNNNNNNNNSSSGNGSGNGNGNGSLRVSNSSISYNNNHNNNNNNNNITASPAAGRKFSPALTRREVIDEEDINTFLTSTSNELLQSSRDLSKFTEKKRRDLSIEKLSDMHARSKPPQISPKKFSDALADGGLSEEAPTNAKFKKKAPGTTTTTIVLNANAINNNSSNGSLNSSSSSIHNGSSGNLSSFKERGDRERDRERDRDSISLSSMKQSGGIVRNAW